LPIFETLSKPDAAKYYRMVANLRLSKFFSPDSTQRIHDLVEFSNAHRVYSIIFISAHYRRKLYPRKKVSKRNWWPWIEFVIFESDTGKWWTEASGETSRKRMIHNVLVDWVYTMGYHGMPATKLPGTTVVFNVDIGEAKIATDGYTYLMGHDLGMNYNIDLRGLLSGQRDSEFLFYSSALHGRRKIYLAHIDRPDEPIEVLW